MFPRGTPGSRNSSLVGLSGSCGVWTLVALICWCEMFSASNRESVLLRFCSVVFVPVGSFWLIVVVLIRCFLCVIYFPVVCWDQGGSACYLSFSSDFSNTLSVSCFGEDWTKPALVNRHL